MIFGYLANGDTTWVWGVVDGIAFMVVAASLFCGAKAIVYPEWRRNGVELALTGSLFWLCPPLVGFALYFCLLHSSRHIRTVFQKLPGTLRRREILWQALGFTLACWFAAAWAFWGLATAGPIDAALLRVVFIGLAALTLPHIVLVDGLLEKPWATSKASREARSFYLPGQEPCESPLAPVRMHPNA